MNTPTAFANFSPGFEHRENPGGESQSERTLKGFHAKPTLSGFNDYLMF
jgi:hypothetical protein